MISVFVTLVLYCILATSNSAYECIGTCYFGRLFPEPQDITNGKYLKGFSYKNIMTDDPRKCYSSCTQDCRCKACQMKDSRCELLDEDKTSRADSFVAGSGYVYYDLKQTMFQGKSHMIPPGICYNGCCQSQPCLNGGTCIEHCQSPKEKFTCNCSELYKGRLCEQQLPFTSCVDVWKSSKNGNIPTNGKYTMLDQRKLPRPVNCAFEKPNRVWTLIESFSVSNKSYHKIRTFHQVARSGTVRSRRNPNWLDYFEDRPFLKYVRLTSTMFRVTCDFPFRSALLPDYLFGYLVDYDIINHGNVDRDCFKFTHINIRGHDFFNALAGVTQVSNKYHFFIDGYAKTCGLEVPGSSIGENNFGYYTPLVNTTVCTARENSTTQYWLGAIYEGQSSRLRRL